MVVIPVSVMSDRSLILTITEKTGREGIVFPRQGIA